MSKLLPVLVLALLLLFVSAPAPGARSDPGRGVGCPAGAAHDSEAASCPGGTGEPQSPPSDAVGTPLLDAGLAGRFPAASGGTQSPEDALAEDIALTSEAKGWTIEEAAGDRRAADVVGRIAVQVAAARPDIFVGSVLSPEPGGAPGLYIKGPADDFVRSLVAKAEVDVKIVDNQPFSFEELEERKLQVHRELETQGFRYVSTGFSVAGAGQITAGVAREPGLPADAAEILRGLPASLRGSVMLTVSDAPIAADNHAYGGMWVRSNGVNKCTSGWSVFSAAGATGVTTAGHCANISQIWEPGVGVWSLAQQGEHRGQWGDVEWHTSTHIEPAKFYSDAATVRWVTALEARAGISQGESVCLYGRASNQRHCRL